MPHIEVTDEVKNLLDGYINYHNESAKKYPKGVHAYLGEKTYSNMIMWLYKEVLISLDDKYRPPIFDISKIDKDSYNVPDFCSD